MADDCRFGDPRKLLKHVLNLKRGHVHAARLYNVLLTVVEEEVPVLVDANEVSSVEPPLAHRGGGAFLVAEVADHDRWRAADQFPLIHVLAVLIYHANLELGKW